MSDLNIHTLTNANLRKLIEQTESTLAELKDEMERRGELSQHHSIESLENHMRSAELGLQTIRQFMAYLLDDMKRNEPAKR